MADSIFGMSGKALQLCEDRGVLLSNNIVNSSTPHYKARDIDFYKILQQSNNTQNSDMLKTNDPRQLSANGNSSISEPVKYVVPMQKSLDGNTVDEEIERKNFIENALHYQVNLTFVQNESNTMMKAIKGE